jgi:hypothetical protein
VAGSIALVAVIPRCPKLTIPQTKQKSGWQGTPFYFLATGTGKSVECFWRQKMTWRRALDPLFSVWGGKGWCVHRPLVMEYLGYLWAPFKECIIKRACSHCYVSFCDGATQAIFRTAAMNGHKNNAAILSLFLVIFFLSGVYLDQSIFSLLFGVRATPDPRALWMLTHCPCWCLSRHSARKTRHHHKVFSLPLSLVAFRCISVI